MRSFIFTFGQVHEHKVGNQYFHKDCVCEIEAPNHFEARKVAFALFGPQFCSSYPKEVFLSERYETYFPQGIVTLNFLPKGGTNK